LQVFAESQNVFAEPDIVDAANRLVAEGTAYCRIVIAVMVIDGTHDRHNGATALATIEQEKSSRYNDDEDESEEFNADARWANALAHPLTARYGEPRLHSCTVKLRLHADGPVVRHKDRWNYSYPTRGEWPCWEPGGRHSKDWRRV
jgi:hypothetical protein